MQLIHSLSNSQYSCCPTPTATEDLEKKKKIYVDVEKIKEYSSKVLKCFIFSLLICRLSTGLQFSHVKIKIAEGKIFIIYSAAYGTGSGQTTDLEEN